MNNNEIKIYKLIMNKKSFQQTFFYLLIICIIFCCGFIQVQAQNYDTTNVTQRIDTIESRKTALGKSYYLGNKPLTLNRLSEITVSNSLAHQKIKQAQVCNVIGIIFGGIGGFCIGYPLGTLLGGGDPIWFIAGIGVGFLAIGIPIAITGDRRLAEGVVLYNQGLQQKNTNTVYFRLGFTPTGMGMAVKF